MATSPEGSPVFAPEEFRLSGRTVVDSAGTVSFEVGIANLQPTFGSLLGAQLIDLYIHAPSGSVPAGKTQSTAAGGVFNYSIAPADAGNQLIEVDGFGTDDWVIPGSASSRLSGSFVQRRDPAGLADPVQRVRRRDAGPGHQHRADAGPRNPGR